MWRPPLCSHIASQFISTADTTQGREQKSRDAAAEATLADADAVARNDDDALHAAECAQRRVCEAAAGDDDEAAARAARATLTPASAVAAQCGRLQTLSTLAPAQPCAAGPTDAPLPYTSRGCDLRSRTLPPHVRAWPAPGAPGGPLQM